MTNVSDIAISECVAELRAASRRPVDPAALQTVVGWMRPQFELILDRADGGKRWAEHGPRLRENSRHLGALADFFGSHFESEIVGIEELTAAVKMVRADCTVRAERTPLAYYYCPKAQVNVREAEEFLHSLAPARALVGV
jgi:hypothetical protein